MTTAPDFPGHSPLTRTEWLICVIAAHRLRVRHLRAADAAAHRAAGAARAGGRDARHPRVQPLGRAAVLRCPPSPAASSACSGGYLTDRLGRRRVLTWSILLYAFSAFAAGFCDDRLACCSSSAARRSSACASSSSPPSRGWPSSSPTRSSASRCSATRRPSRRSAALMVTGANFLARHFAESLPEIHGGHEAWRYTLMSGVIPAHAADRHPAVPAGVAGLAAEEGSGHAEAAEPRRRSSSRELRRATIVTTLMFALQLRRRVRRDPARAADRARTRRGAATSRGPTSRRSVSGVAGLRRSVGGLVGRMHPRRPRRAHHRRGAAACFASSRSRASCSCRWSSSARRRRPRRSASRASSFAGLFTVAQFSFWGNYLPRVYPTHLRGTGESFAANVGGRMIGTSAAFVTTTLAHLDAGGNAVGQAGLGGGARRASPSTWWASLPASSCRSRRREELPD